MAWFGRVYKNRVCESEILVYPPLQPSALCSGGVPANATRLLAQTCNPLPGRFESSAFDWDLVQFCGEFDRYGHPPRDRILHTRSPTLHAAIPLASTRDRVCWPNSTAGRILKQSKELSDCREVPRGEPDLLVALQR